MIPTIEKKSELYKRPNLLECGYAPELGVQLYGKEPLFKYLVPVADEIAPNFMPPDFDSEGIYGLPSGCPDVFAYRLLEGKIDTSFIEKYEQAEELLASLDGFGIDKDAFWYLILFLKDYIDGKVNGCAYNNSAKEDLEEIRDAFKMLDIRELRNNKSASKKSQGDCKITLRVDGHNYEYDNPITLKTLAFCIDQMLPHMEEHTGFDNAVAHFGYEDDEMKYFMNDQNLVSFSSSTKYAENYIYRQFLFHKYLSNFLKQFDKGNKLVARINGHQVGISYDKMLLVSRALYIIGYTKIPDDRRFYDEYNEEGTKKNDTLKNILRRYKEVNIKTENAHYR